MQKILIYQLDNFPLSPFSRNLFNLAPELQNLNCKITLFVTSDQGMDSLPAGVNGRVLGQWLPHWIKLPRHYLAIPQLAHYIRHNCPDAIIARGISFAVPAILARWLSGRRPSIITTLHSFISGDISTRVYRSWPVFKYLANFVVHRSDHIVAVSAGVAIDYINLTGIDQEQIKIIYNPVVSPNIQGLSLEQLNEPWLETSRKHATLLHVGRFAPEKDHETLLNALVEVRRHRDVRLLLIGDGPLRSFIKKLITDLNLDSAVKILGRQENPFAYMARADGLVLTSLFEGLPGVLIQAMSLGCPVASTDIPGASEILEGGLWGPLTPVRDAYKLAESIQAILDHPLAKDSLLNRANTFTAAACAAKFYTLLQN